MEPLFLQAADGERFCIFHTPHGSPRGAILYLHPFAEEMNKSRRMAALQARRLAASGYAVLQIDFHGCGDSSGDFRDSTWEAWREDVLLAARWLRSHGLGALTLWGLRLGALLALSTAAECDPPADRLLLWHPVLSGQVRLNQFLRVKVAAEMLAEAQTRTGVQELRSKLATGHAVEVAGYEISPALAHAIDALRIEQLKPQAGSVQWIEVSSGDDAALSPASQRLTQAWMDQGIDLITRLARGPQFWSTAEVTENPSLIEISTEVACS